MGERKYIDTLICVYLWSILRAVSANQGPVYPTLNNLTSTATCDEGLMNPESLADVCSSSKYFSFMSDFDALVRSNHKISGACERVKPVETPDNEYDFVIIGGGAGGSVVASRLSEISNWKVLLLEAGLDEPAGMAIPTFAFEFLNSKHIWNYTTMNESSCCLSTNGSCPWPSGKNLGGNTAHNAMIYLRGNPKDYDNWADEGNDGWTWDEVEPFFIKGEDNGEIDRVGRKHHGTGGLLSVERLPHLPDMGYAILNASLELGYGVSEDLNGDTRTGFSIVQTTSKHGVRRSSAAAYLRPVRNRENLHISLNSMAIKVIIENDTAIGVEYYKNGEQRSVYVTREVIISGGAMQSPQILLLSGIGPREHLESVDINVVKDLPGVGENLQDHTTVTIPFTVNETDVYDNDCAVAAEYLATQTGPMSGRGTIPAISLLPTKFSSPDYPDVQIFFYGYVAACAPGKIDALKSTGRRTVHIGSSILRPKSRGRITLASKNPFDLPSIWANYLGEPEDVDLMVDSIRIILELINTEALSRFNFTLTHFEVCSDHEYKSYEFWTCIARQKNSNVYHQSGTCKMGPVSDSMAVVDPRLQVHGIKRLRVADASIMPQIPSSNIQAATMMIGERAAHFIKEDWDRNNPDKILNALQYHSNKHSNYDEENKNCSTSEFDPLCNNPSLLIRTPSARARFFRKKVT